MGVVLVSGENKKLDLELTSRLYEAAKDLLLKMIIRGDRKGRMIRIQFSRKIKYNKIYLMSNIGRMRTVGFDHLMLQEERQEKIHFHVFISGGVGARSDKIKSSPVDFLLNSEGEVLLANKGGEYTTRETTSLRDAKCFFGELLREIKRCVEGKGVMQLF
ncbi:MAG: hypothetical protein UT71_C0027G0002 [Parcubacteria group bacterium GW2011_GWF2_40_10]|nr:MAG: hypothetical protein UT71_C0027G0002 [Parcubacteria group bacterium GW2011_GWF2_40_10]